MTPAAVLSILVKTNGVGRAQAQLTALDRKTATTARSVDKSHAKVSRGLSGVAKSAAGFGAAYLGTKGVLDILNSSVKASQEAEVSQKKLQAQLKASGISYKNHAKEIDKVIQKTSELSGLDDEDLQVSFTNIIRVTGNVS